MTGMEVARNLELGRIYGQFAGYFREGLNFLNERNERQFMGRYDYLGGNVLLPLKTEQEYAQLPEPGTPVRAISHIIPDQKTGNLKTNVIQMLVAGQDKDFSEPTPDELYSGYVFMGNIFVTNKIAGISKKTNQLYRQVIISLFGGCYKFSLTDDETNFNHFAETGLHTISGKVDTIINPYQKDGRWLQECVNTLLLEQVKVFTPPQSSAAKPATKPAA